MARGANPVVKLDISANTGCGVSDVLNLRWPTLYETGAEVATLELEIPNDGDHQPDWRLYRVIEPTAVA